MTGLFLLGFFFGIGASIVVALVIYLVWLFENDER